MELTLTKEGIGYVINGLGFKFMFSNIQSRGNKIESYLKIYYEPKQKLLFIGRVELMEIGRRWQIAQHLDKLYRAKGLDWQEVLTRAYTMVLNEFLKNEPPKRLQTVEAQNHYFVYPVLANPYTLVFAPGGSGKSYLALYLATLFQNRVSDDGVGLIPEGKYNTLYLDWETSFEDISRRFTLISTHFNTNNFANFEPPYYRNLAVPLHYKYDLILEDIIKYDIKVLIIDSVVPAIGGNINNADSVGEFFSMLKQFFNANGTRTLLLTHISKQDKRDTDNNNKSPIGSVYFENYPRLVWELKSVNTNNNLNIELKPFKTNVPTPPTLNFSFAFDDDGLEVKSSFAEKVDDGFEDYILQILKNAEEPLKLSDIKKLVKKDLGNIPPHLYSTLQKLEKGGKIHKPRYGYYGYGEYTPNLTKEETKATNNNDEPPF